MSILKDRRHLCLLPWISINIQSDRYTPCRSIASEFSYGNHSKIETAWRSPVAGEFRYQFLSGQSPKHCSNCFELEKYGASERTRVLNDKNFELPSSIDQLASIYSPQILNLEINDQLNVDLLIASIDGILFDLRKISLKGKEVLTSSLTIKLLSLIIEKQLENKIDLILETPELQMSSDVRTLLAKIKRVTINYTSADVSEINTQSFGLFIKKLEVQFINLIWTIPIDWFNAFLLPDFLSASQIISQVQITFEIPVSRIYFNISNFPNSIKSELGHQIRLHEFTKDQKVNILIRQILDWLNFEADSIEMNRSIEIVRKEKDQHPNLFFMIKEIL